MTFDPTKPVQTRDGRKARIVSDKLNSGKYKFIAIITHEDGSENAYTYGKDGYYHNSLNQERCLDLINIPEKREMWVNVYDDFFKCHVGHGSRDVSDRFSGPDRIACVRVEYEVGEGL